MVSKESPSGKSENFKTISNSNEKNSGFNLSAKSTITALTAILAVAVFLMCVLSGCGSSESKM